MSMLQDIFIYMSAALIAVPLAHRFGFGSVLGYLLAGVIIGPVLGIVGAETEEVQHVAEFGVVMMLFLIGLELQPAKLWHMRTQLVGLGGLQVTLTMALFSAIAYALMSISWQTALAIGMILSLSSTAIVLQSLAEKKYLAEPAGRASFSVLLLQDIAVIPMLAILPFLALAEFNTIETYGVSATSDGHAQTSGLIDHLPIWERGLVVVGVIVAIILMGRFFTRPVFHYIAKAKLTEIFTAFALFQVIAISMIMDMIGLSPALGTFLAGVVLSDSEYRHALEGDIAPFKGLLLGLFFITVGAGVDFQLFLKMPDVIAGLTFAIIGLKMLILFGLGRIFGLRGRHLFLFALALPQAGEFAFVLFSYAQQNYVLSAEVTEPLVLVVTMSMLLTPLLFVIYDQLIHKRYDDPADASQNADEVKHESEVVIAGVGRFGQVVHRLLAASGYDPIVFEQNPELIETRRKLNLKTYYGDATRPEVLNAAGMDRAKLFIAALDDREKQIGLVRHISAHYPNCEIIARAFDRHHVYELKEAGATHVIREVFDGALSAGKLALITLGAGRKKADKFARVFKKHDEEVIKSLQDQWQDGGMSEDYIANLRSSGQELRQRIICADTVDEDEVWGEDVSDHKES